MIFGLLKKWFGKKKKEVEEKKTKKPHPAFPSIPLGIKINGLIKLKPSSGSYFLLNEDKLITKLPQESSNVVISISQFNLFGLTVYRAYINNRKSYFQLHYRAGELLDILYFNRMETIDISTNPKLEKEWKSLIGDKDLKTPSGTTFLRDWNDDEEGHVDAVYVLESLFTEPWDLTNVHHNMMLYARILEGGNPDVDIEYLLASITENRGSKNIIIETAIRLDASDLEIF